MVTDFFTVFTAIASALGGRSYLLRPVDGGGLVKATLPVAFWNAQPELRKSQPYPALTLTCLDPVADGEFVVTDDYERLVTVDAAAPYLEGMGSPTIALADGQTFQVTRWRQEGVGNDFGDVFTVVFSAVDFVSIASATLLEVATVLARGLPGVSVGVRPNNVLRLGHPVASSYAGLQITGGTAAALIATFPSYRAQGRDAGQEVQILDPPLYYHFPFRIGCKSKRLDDHALMMALLDRVFVVDRAMNQRWITAGDQSHEVIRGDIVSDPLPLQGVFASSCLFTMRHVPVAVAIGELDAQGDSFNGGNYAGAGVPAVDQAPFGVTFSPIFDLPDSGGIIAGP